MNKNKMITYLLNKVIRMIIQTMKLLSKIKEKRIKDIIMDLQLMTKKIEGLKKIGYQLKNQDLGKKITCKRWKRKIIF